MMIGIILFIIVFVVLPLFFSYQEDRDKEEETVELAKLHPEKLKWELEEIRKENGREALSKAVEEERAKKAASEENNIPYSVILEKKRIIRPKHFLR